MCTFCQGTVGKQTDEHVNEAAKTEGNYQKEHTVAKLSIEWEPILSTSKWSATRVISCCARLYDWFQPSWCFNIGWPSISSPLFVLSSQLDWWVKGQHCKASFFEVELQLLVHRCAPLSTSTHQFLLIYTNLGICMKHAGALRVTIHSIFNECIHQSGSASSLHLITGPVSNAHWASQTTTGAVSESEWWIAMLIRLN